MNGADCATFFLGHGDNDGSLKVHLEISYRYHSHELLSLLQLFPENPIFISELSLSMRNTGMKQLLVVFLNE